MKKLEIIHKDNNTFTVEGKDFGHNGLQLPEVLKKVTEFCLEEVKPEIYCPPKDTLVDLLDKDGNVVAIRYATGQKSKDGISIYIYNDGATSITQCGCSVQNKWRITPGYWVKHTGSICPIDPQAKVNVRDINESMSGSMTAKHAMWASKIISEFKVISYS